MPSSRVSLRAVLVTAVASLATSLLTTSTASADDPAATELQQRLITARQDINRLYAQAAAANERVNGATLELEQAEKALEENRAVKQRAESAFEDQRAVVGAMTVEQQLNGSTDQAMLSLLQGTDAPEIMEEATSLQAVDEAMTAEMDRLDARQTVLTSASRAVAADVAKQRTALADRKKARSQITAAISQAEAQEKSLAAERDGVLRQIAQLQGRSIEDVTREQDQIDEQIDQGGPTPGGGGGTTTPDPEPTTPRPTTPTPTTPPPTTPPPTDPTPPPSSSKVEKAIAYAEAQLGEPYAWGGAGPSKWDCSGLTMQAWKSAGVSLSHYAPSQYTATKKVSVSKIQRGDLLFWSDGSVGSIYHVAIYLGGGKMIHAPRPGRSVEIVSVSYWIKPDLASRPG